MLTSIKKLTSSFFTKLLVVIIILPFIFWGMGDVFRGGNQNIILTIDKEKISSQEFVEYLNRLRFTDQEREDLVKANLLEKILSDYVGKKIISLEVKDLGVNISDKSLKNIIINDKTFFKDEKFSRTEYEKFLLQSGTDAPSFEKNLSQQEKKRQLLGFLSMGAMIPEFLVEKAYKEENQIVTIKYINLNNYYNAYDNQASEIEKIYKENKDLFIQEFKTISFTELKPEPLTGKKEYDEDYYNKINQIENDILDGKKIENIAEVNNLNLIKTEEINSQKNNLNNIKYDKIPDGLFKTIFFKKKLEEADLININNKYYIAAITKINKKNRKLEDKDIQDTIKAQLKIKRIIDGNNKIVSEISKGLFSEARMKEFAKEKKLTVNNTTINGLKDNKIFKESLVKEIFKYKNKQINLITDSMLANNFLVLVEKSETLKLNKDSKKYKQYKTKARLELSNRIFNTYDKSVNVKYDIDINKKVVNRIKNSFQ